MRKCPHCLKKISETARKCKFCGKWVIDNNPFREEKEKIKSIKGEVNIDAEVNNENIGNSIENDDVEYDLNGKNEEGENRNDKENLEDYRREAEESEYTEWLNDISSALLIWLLLMIGIAIIGAIFSAMN